MNVTKPNQCTGCSLCIHVCQVGAIKQVLPPKAAFWYPEVDESLCVKCNQCVAACPQNHAALSSNEEQLLLAQNTELDSLKAATSGGVASALAKAFVQKGGVVYGAAFDSSMRLRHIRCTDEKNCERIKGSKYVQSDLREVYAALASDLKQHKDVLFIGTPCQCAGIRKAFEKHDALYCCDFICNGVGSPVVFEKHIAYLERTYHCKIVNYVFRPKKYHYLEPYEWFIDSDGRDYHIKSPWKKWGSMYYSGLLVRPSCYECKFIKPGASGSDITLSDIPLSLCDAADFPHDVKQYGGSLIRINTKKGEILLGKTGSLLYTKRMEGERNHTNKHTEQNPNDRDRFLTEACESLEKAKRQYLGLPLKFKGLLIETLDRFRKKRG